RRWSISGADRISDNLESAWAKRGRLILWNRWIPTTEGGSSMMPRWVVIFMLAVLPVITLAASIKRDWKEGTWRDSQRFSETRGAIAVGPSIVILPKVVQRFVIGTPEYFYSAEQRLKGRQKPLPMTVNGSVKYALDKETIYVIGDDGKEYKLALTKKVLRTDK